MPEELRPVPDLWAYLPGTWHTERTARDLASGEEGRFSGVTVFGPATAPEEGLVQREDGDFVWQGVSRPAGRTLRLLPGATPSSADVRFADGREFHTLDLAEGRFTATHPCAADLYEGEFTVLDADRWRTVWRVRGPAKDLVLTTRYARTGGA
ncbi:DUF6314 family protein [Streptomyces abyssomicinicus]|uniref:DUF6314 family protein n=1 Tax=Streptomyces abyssomicinicus TaxID=574929 RepID=UPI0012507AEC|nr:DUF6314 family protein [Streptomyces abyssomicinicus]